MAQPEIAPDQVPALWYRRAGDACGTPGTSDQDRLAARPPTP